MTAVAKLCGSCKLRPGELITTETGRRERRCEVCLRNAKKAKVESKKRRQT
jgi:hypothetical protein